MMKVLQAVIALLLLSACSNDSILEGVSESSSRDAKLEDAYQALDGKDYDAAISELAPMYNTTGLDPRIGRLLASAYMGKAGIDATLMMENVSGVSTATSFDVVASMIDSEYVTVNEDERYLDGNATAGITEEGDYTYEIDLMGTLNKAREILLAMDQRGLATADDRIQLGIASAAHFIMVVGNQTAIALNRTLDSYNPDARIYGDVPVPINTGAYGYYRTSQSVDRKYSWSRVDAGDFGDSASSGVPSSFQEDLSCVNDAVVAFNEAFSSSNDLENALDSFLRSALGLGPDVMITDELISEYGSGGIFAYVNRLANQ
ncbi:MAG: hypothetical protein KBC76_11845 [Deltaproteobacteria bacterium]|jgi:hypothetical protein|nr:hypothetical protein [Deltaproteobacteria bacterium]